MKKTRLPNGAGSVTLNTDVAEGMVSDWSKKFVARVGILGAKTTRLAKQKNETHAQYKKRAKQYIKDRQGAGGEQTNAEIGLLHEKGSITKHIPRRSFLEVPLVMHAKELANVGETIKSWIKDKAGTGEEAKIGWSQAHVDLGIAGENIVQRAFRTMGYGDWAPNSQRTKDRKGSGSPLIDTAQLRRSIMSKVVEK